MDLHFYNTVLTVVSQECCIYWIFRRSTTVPTMVGTRHPPLVTWISLHHSPVDLCHHHHTKCLSAQDAGATSAVTSYTACWVALHTGDVTCLLIAAARSWTWTASLVLIVCHVSSFLLASSPTTSAIGHSTCALPSAPTCTSDLDLAYCIACLLFILSYVWLLCTR